MATSFLDTDLADTGRRLAEFRAWWTEQLAAMIPARPRRRAVARVDAVAWYEPGQDLEVTRAGRPIPIGRARRLAPTIAIPERLVLRRALVMPALPEADVARAVRLDLDRLMPFPPGAALTELAIAPADAAGSRAVTLAALPVAEAEAALAAAGRAGIDPAALAVLEEDGAIRFDFLPALRRLRGERDVHAKRRFWWRAVIAAFLLNLIVLVAADARAFARLNAIVAAHGAIAANVRSERRRIEAEQGWRRAIVARHRTRDPLALIADLAARLPRDATARRLELDGGHGRLTGIRQPGTDVIGALRRDPRLRDVRATSADVIAPVPQGQPFDISFDLAG